MTSRKVSTFKSVLLSNHQAQRQQLKSLRERKSKFGIIFQNDGFDRMTSETTHHREQVVASLRKQCAAKD